MINRLEKKQLIFKIIIILFISLVVLSIVRVSLVHSDISDSSLIYALIAKELLFSFLSAAFIMITLYALIKKEFYSVNTKAVKYAFTDALTGLYNRHYLNDFLDKFTALRKKDTNFAVIFIDIDHFKKVNDSLGHSTGDCVLKNLSSAFKFLTRPEDILCRYGGEEFVIIFNDISKKAALSKAEQIRQKVEDMAFECEQKHITISLGLSMGESEDNITQTLEEADLALYIAKGAGRNCVKFFEDDREVKV